MYNSAFYAVSKTQALETELSSVVSEFAKDNIPLDGGGEVGVNASASQMSPNRKTA